MWIGRRPAFWSARAVRKRVAERCSDRPKQGSGQPGMFGCEKQCRQAHGACLPNGRTGKVQSLGQLF